MLTLGEVFTWIMQSVSILHKTTSYNFEIRQLGD